VGAPDECNRGIAPTDYRIYSQRVFQAEVYGEANCKDSVLCSSVAFAQEHQKPVFIKATGCESKLASVLFSSFKDSMRAGIARYEVVPDLSDYGKNDVVLVIQMACGERNNAVSIASIYGLAKCFGPRNCHQSINGTTLNLLMCDPSGEKQCGFELLKELDYVLSRTDPRSMQLE
jgi:hypothetical protein